MTIIIKLLVLFLNVCTYYYYIKLNLIKFALFIESRSTTSNLSMVRHFILNAFDLNCQVDVIYTDFSRTFDKIDHNMGTCFKVVPIRAS
jgi:hypothetical protein